MWRCLAPLPRRSDSRSVINKRYRERGWSLSFFSVLPGDKDFCSAGDYAMCADCSLCHSRVVDAWKYDSDNTVDEINFTFWLHCARNSCVMFWIHERLPDSIGKSTRNWCNVLNSRACHRVWWRCTWNCHAQLRKLLTPFASDVRLGKLNALSPSLTFTIYCFCSRT
jgi:hypothetical protein